MFSWGLPCHAFQYELEDGSDLIICALDNGDSTCDFGDSRKYPMWVGVACDFSDQKQLESFIDRYLKECDIQVKQSKGEFFHVSCIFNGISGISGGVSIFEKCVESDTRLLVSHSLLHGYGEKTIQVEIYSGDMDGLSIWEHRELKQCARGFWEGYRW